MAPKGSGAASFSNQYSTEEKTDKHDGSVSASAEILIRLPNGEMLPLSKLPVKKEQGLGGYSITNQTDNPIMSPELTSEIDNGSTPAPTNSRYGEKDPKQKLRSILENKKEYSSTPKEND